MTPPVDNLDQWTRLVAADELPYHEALARLYELSERYGDRSASATASSAAERHLEATEHRLAFGCCADEDSLLAAVAREERRLLQQLERERY